MSSLWSQPVFETTIYVNGECVAYRVVCHAASAKLALRKIWRKYGTGPAGRADATYEVKRIR